MAVGRALFNPLLFYLISSILSHDYLRFVFACSAYNTLIIQLFN